MAVSNQLKGPVNKVGETEPSPVNMGNARWSPPKSGLNKEGVPAAIALKSKKITNLKLPANF